MLTYNKKAAGAGHPRPLHRGIYYHYATPLFPKSKVPIFLRRISIASFHYCQTPFIRILRSRFKIPHFGQRSLIIAPLLALLNLSFLPFQSQQGHLYLVAILVNVNFILGHTRYASGQVHQQHQNHYLKRSLPGQISTSSLQPGPQYHKPD